ncbi:MAG: hypothetical protein BGO78_01390 [Chloroflexi bacterium 44-23]|nr:MAG: hypothetical protein BGO78_01390 [Chloroflexi bacterium 44-23]
MRIANKQPILKSIIISIMVNLDNKTKVRKINTGGTADLAFAIVVLASYFAMFSALKNPNIFRLIVMVLLGIAYISIGIYGYSFCLNKKQNRFIILYFFIQVILGSLIVFLGEGSGFSAILLLPLAGHAVVLTSGYWLYFLNGMIVLGYVFAVRAYSSSWADVMPSLPAIIAGLIYIMIFTQMALDEEDSRKKAEKLYDELEVANIRLLKYANEIEEMATIQERNRLAREIHDGLGHYLTTILIQLQAAEAILPTDKEKAMDSIRKARSQSKLALIDVRQSVSAFRFDNLDPEEVDQMIERALKPCEWVGIHSTYQVIGEKKPLSGIILSTLFRIAQETVNNTCKYSGAKNFLFSVNYELEDKMRIAISDDGIGAESITGGYGLIGLKERIELLNGTLQINANNGDGFKLEIVLPYE